MLQTGFYELLTWKYLNMGRIPLVPEKHLHSWKTAINEQKIQYMATDGPILDKVYVDNTRNWKLCPIS